MSAMEERQASPQEIEQAKRDWLESIHPLVMQKSSVLGLGGMRVAVAPDGSFSEFEYIMTDEQRQLIAEIDALIENLKPAILRNLPAA